MAGSANRGRVVGVLLLGVGIVALSRMWKELEAGFIYFPERSYAATPADVGLRSEDLSIPSRGAVLKGWWISGGGRRALLYFHGNGGNISHRLDRVRMLVAALGLDVALVDYRGYGASTGRPDEDGLYADGEAVYSAAVARGFRADQIVLFGESLGSAIAIETALRHPCAGVILETPFLSIAAMARAVYPFLPAFLVRTRYDNEAKIARVTAPKLIAAAEKDDVVPPGHARRLYELAAPPRQFFLIRGATHNDTYLIGGQEYLGAWKTFLEGLP